MPTNTEIIESKWFYQNKNGDDFSLNTSDFTQNLVGNIFENVKLIATVRTYTYVSISAFYITDDSINKEGGGFDKYISVGDRCRMVFSDTPLGIFIFDVTSISNDTIYYTLVQNNVFTFPQSYMGEEAICLISDLSYLRYDHGLTPSEDSSENYRSKLDGETTSFIVSDLGTRPVPLDPRSTLFVDGEKTAINSNYGTFKARFVQDSLSPILATQPYTVAQDFEIEHIFKIQDYSEEDITNYINRFKPDNYLGENTLNYNAKFEFRTVETAPSTSKVGKYLDKSNVGYFSENLNGRRNGYSITDLVITRVSNGLEIDNIASSEPSKVSFTINGDGLQFVSTPVIVLNHFAMISDYEFKNVNFSQLFFNETIRVEGVSTETGSLFTEAKILSFTDSTVNVEFTINPSSSDLDNEQYLLSVSVGDSSIPNLVSDKVSEIIKTGTYQSGFDIEGLLGSVSMELYQRDCNPYIYSGFSSFPIIAGELIYTKLKIPVIGGEIVSIDIETINRESSDDIQVVDSYNIDTSSFETIAGVQEIQSDLPTPYSHGLNGKIEKVSSGMYQVVFPYRLPFSEERKVIGLSDTLFDQSEPNQGKNESTYYQYTKDLDVHIAYRIGMLSDGRVTYYRYRTPPLMVRDFENTL